jgi:hypothetical protein
MNYVTGSLVTNFDKRKCRFTMFLKELDLSKCGMQGYFSKIWSSDMTGETTMYLNRYTFGECLYSESVFQRAN